MNKVTPAIVLLSAYLRVAKVAASCSTGWTLNSGNGLCYQFFTTLKNHNEAIDYCYTLDALLATPKDLGEVDFIANNVISAYGQYAWIGLVKRTDGESWKFFDGFTFDSGQESWNLWRTGFPSAGQRCGHLKGEDMNYKFQTSPCDYDYKFVCQKKTTAHVCPTTWFRSPFGSICYKQYGMSSTFQETVNLCNDDGTDILMPRDSGEDMFLSWYFSQNHQYDKVWIGLQEQNNVFSWQSGAETTFTSWEDGEPDSIEDCAAYALSAGNSYHKWFGLQCSQPAAGYCQDTNFYTWVASTTHESTTNEITTEVTTKVTTGVTTEVTTETTTEVTTQATTEVTTEATTEVTSTSVITETTPATSSTSSSNIITTTVSGSLNNTCACFCLKNHTNITAEELEEKISQIKNNLTVDAKSLTSAIRLLTSAYDPRASSQNIGSVGIAVLVSIGCFLLVLDCVPTNGCILGKKKTFNVN